MWVLCQKLAEKMNIPAVEVYRNYIKDLNVFRDVKISRDATKTLIYSWGLNGLGWLAEKVDSEGEFDIVRLWYGSSTYNTKQMSRLINNIVEDCKLQNIPTLEEIKISKLIEEWGK